MTKILDISEATSIAFHGMVLVAISQVAINANDIAEITNASKHHTSKVMQRLVKHGLIGSTRGPSGGFYLKKKPEDILLIDILEAIEGKVELTPCPIDNEFCPFGSCLMGGICFEISEKLLNHLKSNTLSDVLKNIPENFSIETLTYKE